MIENALYSRRRSPRFETHGVLSNKFYNKETGVGLTCLLKNVSEDGLQIEMVKGVDGLTTLDCKYGDSEMSLKVIWQVGALVGMRLVKPEKDLTEVFSDYII